MLALVESDNDLKGKINRVGNTNNLEITPATENTVKSFKLKEQAKADLKAWCTKKSKVKKHKNELCKEPQQVGWLFGGQRK